jgi:hypothetical protein
MAPRMADDAGIQRAIEIGKRNAAVIELLQNWCAHARVIHDGGCGLVEQMTGLPIGARSIRCPHARAHGWSGMNMEVIVLDFHDRNCVGCEHRSPVKLPNLSELVGRRDAEREWSKTAQRNADELERREVERRATKRQPLPRSGDHARNSLLELLEKFDEDPSDKNLAALEESSRAVPSAFDIEIQDALFDIAESERAVRARGALTILRERAADRARLVSAALAVIGRHSVDLALEIFLSEPNLAKSEDIERAAEPLVWFAHQPSSDPLGRSMDDSGKPEGMLLCHRSAPGAVEQVLRRWLRDDEKESRRAAALCVLDVMRAHDPDICARFAGDLIASFSRKDDSYNRGRASATVSRVLAEALEKKTSEVDEELARSIPVVDDAGREGIIEAYIEVFSNRDRSFRRENRVRKLVAAPHERVAFQRLISFFTGLPDDPDALRAICRLFSDDYWMSIAWDLVGESVPTLVGAAALAYDQMRETPSSAVHDPRPPFVQELEKKNRRMLLESCADAALHVAVLSACHHPERTHRNDAVDTILKTLANAPAEADGLRGGLVTILGKVGSDPAQLARVLPVVYGAATDHSVLVRGAAIEAYSHLVENVGASGIPDLLHEVAVSMLGDPFLYVHSRALVAVEDASFSPGLQKETEERALLLALTHVSGKRWDLAARAIRVWLRFSRSRASLTPKQLARTIISWLLKFDPNEAASLIRDISDSLRESAEYPRLLAKCFDDESCWETSRKSLFDEIAALSPEETIVIKDLLVATATRHWAIEEGFSDRIFWLLVGVEAWGEAAIVGKLLVDALEDTTENRPKRLRAGVVLAAAELEGAAKSGEVETVIERARTIRNLRDQIALDDKANEDVRGLFPPVHRPS